MFLSVAIESKHLEEPLLMPQKQNPLSQKDSPLWDLDNVIISQHASALSPEMYEGRRQIFIENLKKYLNNETLLHICDLEKGGFKYE
ncbi:MAG: hypothetical protein Ct9H90mP2_06910 [Dehalococcoidia bacterium]|nr:MAG: hypothetical protein Ct9H90mP2_06910 [Dehalococcoidia bacterium]